MDLLRELIFEFNPQIVAYFNVSTQQKQILIFCYQAGYLILPMLSPILIWVIFNHKIKTMALTSKNPLLLRKGGKLITFRAFDIW